MELNLQYTCLHYITNHSLLVTGTKFLDGNTKYTIDLCPEITVSSCSSEQDRDFYYIST
jgi:hypothetical protein